jgi:serine kinase of HPr protein (carbohydrate metabolism regulator)
MDDIRGTTIAFEGAGVLLQGGSGAGKSDLAVRLIEAGARLIADDYTALRVRDGRLYAAAPPSIRGLLEVRGLGVIRLAAAEEPCPLVCAIELVAPADVPRLPEDAWCTLVGVALPLFRLAPFEASAPAKVRLAVRIVTGSIIRL